MFDPVFADELKFNIEQSETSEDILFPGNSGEPARALYTMAGDALLELYTPEQGAVLAVYGQGGDITVRGIFDESVLTEDGKKTTRPVPRIILYSCPEYESEKTKVIVRGKVYRAKKHEVDANIGIVLWLL